MYIRSFFLLVFIAGLTACGDGDSKNNPDSQLPPSGYNPALPTQTLTPEELADVDEIVTTSTVTVYGNVSIANQDLIVKGNLIIK